MSGLSFEVFVDFIRTHSQTPVRRVRVWVSKKILDTYKREPTYTDTHEIM